jgi:hypothetical protein
MECDVFVVGEEVCLKAVRECRALFGSRAMRCVVKCLVSLSRSARLFQKIGLAFREEFCKRGGQMLAVWQVLKYVSSVVVTFRETIAFANLKKPGCSRAEAPIRPLGPFDPFLEKSFGFVIIQPEHIPLPPHTIRTTRDHMEMQQSHE